MNADQHKLNGERRGATWPLRQWSVLPLLMVMVWVGCKQAGNAGDTNPVGTYALVSVDGNKVPCTVKHDKHTLAVKSGTFAINADGTCSSKVVFSAPSGGDSSREVKATYTRQGAKLTMKWEGAGATTGTVEGDTFTMNNEGMIFVYRK
jgi:hypothetical protein